jgi:hypothetical protein
MIKCKMSLRGRMRVVGVAGLFHSHLVCLRINSESNSESSLKTTKTHVIVR